MGEEQTGNGRRGQSRRRTKASGGSRILPVVIGVLLAATATAAGAAGFFYIHETERYEEAFLPNTRINGIDASGKTVEQVRAELEKGMLGYTLQITGRNSLRENITGEEIGLHAEFDGSLEKILEGQEPGEWVSRLKSGDTHEISTMLAFDEELLAQKIDSLKCLEPERMEASEDARISEYDSEIMGYTIIPETQGTVVDRDVLLQAAGEAVRSLTPQLSLREAGCYKEAAVKADDEGLLALAAELNTYTGAVVTHVFGNRKEVLDGDEIHKWLSVENGEVILNEASVSDYVKSLAEKYNTAYKAKSLKTTYGPSVTISGGNYGWRIDQKKETEAVLAVIRAGEQQTREPEYSQTAASHGENDYGSTYVEINLTAQHLYFYKEGRLVTESDFVSGNASRGWSTPAGAYPLTYKQRNAVLKGENYRTPVSYWMPFNGGIGMHDANWRGSFGGSIYKTNGSHGCINLPPAIAQTIYENISAGTPVLCYHLDGTESGKTSTPPAGNGNNGVAGNQGAGSAAGAAGSQGTDGAAGIPETDGTAGSAAGQETGGAEPGQETSAAPGSEPAGQGGTPGNDSGVPGNGQETGTPGNGSEAQNGSETPDTGSKTPGGAGANQNTEPGPGNAGLTETVPAGSGDGSHPGGAGTGERSSQPADGSPAPEGSGMETTSAVQTEPISGNDDNHVGPGYDPVTEETESPIGPGY